jgi:predicted PilT family ATPase
VFIKGGTITEILTLKHVVKMPSGMQSEDLARPVIEVSSFLD